MAVDTSNRFFLGAQGEEIVFPILAVPRRLSKADALNLAAWLVAIADDEGKFPEMLKAVQST
jgi:hypothetical protein